VSRPRLLLVPGISELEWQIKPSLEEWAEVASFDPPGVGASDEGWSRAGVVRAGLDELDRRGWERFVLVADWWGTLNAIALLEARPDGVSGFALGHAALSNRMSGPRAPITEEVWAALGALISQDYLGFVRHALRQLTQDAYDDELAMEMMNRVPVPVARAHWEAGSRDDYDLAAVLRARRLPLLLAKHKGCLLYTEEGFDDAVAAFPEARVCVVSNTPTVHPGFASALRDFCGEIPDFA
jgi:pimeloyl-ACP methyl ester carboxylesterase